MTPRRLLLLAGAAIVVIAGALWLSIARQPSGGADRGELLYPQLRERINDVAAVRIIKGESALVTLRRGTDDWTVEERANYTADLGRIRRLLLALAEAHLLEEKTSKPANYPAIGVEDPGAENASSLRLELEGIDPAIALIVGKRGPGADSTYVRRSGESESWLVDRALDVLDEPVEWLSRDIVDLGADRIQSAAIEFPGGRSYEAAKASRDAADFEVTGLARDEKLSSPGAASGFATALLGLRLDDVRPLAELEGETAARATYRTFDGLILKLEGRANGDDRYLIMSTGFDQGQAERFHQAPAAADDDEGAGGEAASGDDSADAERQTRDEAFAATRTEAERLSDRSAGWAYRIPDYKYGAIFKPLEDLLAQD